MIKQRIAGFATAFSMIYCGTLAAQDQMRPANSSPYQKQHPPSITANPPVGPFLTQGVQSFVNVEFLYWYGNLSDTPAFIKNTELPSIIGPGNLIAVPTKSRDLDWKWDPGVRAALGLVFDRDGWDLKGEWTYFHNNADRSKKVSSLDLVDSNNPSIGNQVLFSPWSINPGDVYSSISTRISLNFNQIDLVIGRRFWNSRYLSLRPFFGTRGYWSSLRFNVRSNLDATSSAISTVIFKRDRERLRQSDWGVGFVGGLDSNWYFAEKWSFAVKGDVALVYGKINQKRTSTQFQVDGNMQITTNIKSTYFHPLYAMLPMIDLGLGIQWESLLGNQDRFYLSFLLGWENHFLLDYLRLDRSFEDQDGHGVFAADGNLTMSGIVARAAFQF